MQQDGCGIWPGLTGWVKSADLKGTSLLSCPGLGLSVDVVVPRPVASPAELSPNDTVAFDVRPGGGQPMAAAPLWKLTGWDGEGDPNQYGQFIGTIKTAMTDGSYWVDCPPVTKLHRFSATIPAQVMKSCHLMSSNAVAFNVHLNQNGRPQVSLPLWKCLSTNWKVPEDNGLLGSGPQQKQEQHQPDQGTQQEEVKCHVGKLKSVDVTNGFSIARCPASGLNRDIVVRKAVADPHLLRVNDVLAFALQVTARGLPQAAAPCWKLTAPGSEGELGEFASYRGQVGKLLPNGCCYVSSPKAAFESGANPLADMGVRALCKLKFGETIAFNLKVGDAGQPEIATPIWKQITEAAAPPNGKPAAAWQAGLASGGSSQAIAKASGDKAPAAVAAVEAIDQQAIYMASVKRVDHLKGISFFSCRDTSIVGDLCVAKSIVESRSFTSGDVVAFYLQIGPAGTPQVVAPVWKLVGAAVASAGKQIPQRFGKHLGRLQRLSGVGAWTVECPELFEAHGRHAIMLDKVATTCKFSPGEMVVFDALVGVAGQPLLTAPCWKCVAGAASAAAAQGTLPKVIERVAEIPSPGAKLKAVATAASAAASKASQKPPPTTQALLRPQLANRTPAPADGAEDASAGQQSETPQAINPDAVYMGVVSTASAAQGFSTVSCPESGSEHDVFVNGSVASPGRLKKHDVVAFKINVNCDGLPEAAPPLWKLVGWSGREPPRLGEFVGYLRTSAQTGRSHVECADVASTHGCEAEIHEKVMEFCGLSAGDIVAFSVKISPAGKPHVLAPCWKCCTEDDPTEEGVAQGEAEPGAITEVQAVDAASAAGVAQEVDAAPDKPSSPALASKDRGTKGDMEVVSAEPRGKVEEETLKPSTKPSSPHGSSVDFTKSEPVLIGIVRTANEIDDFSMVSCPDSGFDGEVKVPRSVADPDILCPDEFVAFPVDSTQRSAPKARAPFWKLMCCSSQDRPTAFAEFRGQIGKEASKGIGKDASKGLVAIDCIEVVAKFGAPAYISKSVMYSCILASGDTIAFNLSANGGRPVEVAAPVWRCCTAPVLDDAELAKLGFDVPPEGTSKKKASPTASASPEAREPEAKRQRTGA